MPARVWLWAALAAVAIAVAAVLLRPSDESLEAVASGSPPQAAGLPAPATPPGAPAPVGAAEPVLAVAPVDPALAADLLAVAELKAAAIPEANGATTFENVEAAAHEISFLYRVAIDGEAYDLVAERDLISAGLVAFGCDDAVCFEPDPSVIGAVCADAQLGPLVRRGAVIRYLYVDAADRELATIAVTAANCP